MKWDNRAMRLRAGRNPVVLNLLVLLTIGTGFSQALLSTQGPSAPLPDAPTLLREVEKHQKQLDKTRENYTFRSIQTVRQLDKRGGVKKIETEEREVFFVNRHRIQRLVRKNGKDLTPDEAKKEQERVEKEVQKYSQPGQEDKDRDEITVSRLLEIVSFSNPRRVSLNGRNTVVFDFVGDPHAKTHGRDEEALKKISGTVWIDEADREVSRMSATLEDNYHVGFGLLASVAKGSNLVFDQALIRNEVWLPTAIELHLQAKALLVIGFRAEVQVRFDQYKKFQTDAEQQPGATVTPK
ncbi:MAG TPA: hypothetical protein VGM27_11565 [Acidobacteriaceae bacterium]|jgi:hypothetical protein